jgi:HSP20 family protein
MANMIKKDGNENRSVARQDPFNPFQMMRDFLFDSIRGGGELAWNPSFEVRESDNAYVFKADLPGTKPDDLDVCVVGNRLEVRGKRDQETEQDEGTYHTYERSYGSFARAFTLPETADLDKIRSDLKDGVLTLVIPKRAPSGPQRRKVQIGSGEKH